MHKHRKKLFRNRLIFFGIFYSVFFLVAFFVFIPHASANFSLPDLKIKGVAEVLKDTSSGEGKTVRAVWQNLLNLVNGFVIALLIIVAFAQILRINVNTYGIKKILPTLVMAILAANFSFFFCRLLIDIANVTMDAVINGGGHGFTSYQSLQNPTWADPGSGKFSPLDKGMTSAGNVFWLFIVQFLALALAILFIILAFLFFVRIWLIYFLTALAPLAFMALVLPQTKNLFNQWWTNFSKWVFMPVVSIFWLYLGSLWMQYAGGGSAWLINIVFTGICFYLAITTPFKMGGAVMNAWGGFGKKAWGKTGGAYLGGVYNRQKDKLLNRLTTVPEKPQTWSTKRLLRGLQKAHYQVSAGVAKPGQLIDKGAARQRYYTQQEKDVRAKALSNADKDIYYDAYKKHLGGRKKLDKAREGRLYAKFRSWIGEERPTFENLTPDLLEDALRKRKALDASGQLLSEKDLAKNLNSQDFLEVKAIVNRARQLMNSTIHKSKTEEVMNTGYTDPAGVHHNPIIPPAYSSKWRAGDIARDLYASSAVGNPIDELEELSQGGHGAIPAGSALGKEMALSIVLKDIQPEAMHKLSSVGGILGEEKGQALMSAAMHGTGSYDDFVKEQKIDLSTLNAGSQSILKDSFETIRGGRDSRVDEAVQAKTKGVEDEMEGIKMVMESSRNRGVKLPQMKSQLKKVQELMANEDLDASASILEEMSGSMGKFANAEEMKKALSKRMEHLTNGLGHFDELNKEVLAIQDPQKRKDAFLDMKKKIQSDPGSYINEVKQKKLDETRTNAQAEVASKVVMGNLASNPATQGLTVGQLPNSSHALEELTNAVHGLQHSISSSGGGALNQVTKIDPMSMGAKQMLADSINNSVKQGAITMSTQVKDAIGSKQFRESIAQGMKKAMSESTIKTHVTNHPAPGSGSTPPPPPPNPPANPPKV